jgi:ribosomal protein S12 methylthiotransferase
MSFSRPQPTHALSLPLLPSADDAPRAHRAPLPLLGTQGEPEAPVVSFISLGCAKNLVDSEKMLGRLAESGAVISGDESLADTIVVNTCGFLESSRQEALGILRELAQRKRRGDLQRIVVAGCLVQRDGEKIRDAVPEVDALVGVNNRDDVVRAVWRMQRDANVDRFLGDYHESMRESWHDTGRLRLTPRHYAYVRISEGCNQKCTFCTIPSIRGPMHSKSPDEIVREARELIADGAEEIILIGQDTTSYGQDIGGPAGLAGLLRRLDADLDGARWVRLMYVYPSVFTDEMMDAIAECERIVKYIDIPLQHISDRMLRLMGRRIDRARTEQLLEKLRRRIPGVSIRTTFIVGFPGETESDFQDLLDFAAAFNFDAAGAFRYSLERETPSGRMNEQIEESVKEERYERFMLAQQELAFALAARRVGSSFEVVVDGEDERGNLCRHAGQAPEIDSVCILPDGDLAPGTRLCAKCVATDDYDLVVRPERTTAPAGSGRRGRSRRRK